MKTLLRLRIDVYHETLQSVTYEVEDVAPNADTVKISRAVYFPVNLRRLMVSFGVSDGEYQHFYGVDVYGDKALRWHSVSRPFELDDLMEEKQYLIPQVSADGKAMFLLNQEAVGKTTALAQRELLINVDSEYITINLNTLRGG
jgi:hypothetical protein